MVVREGLKPSKNKSIFCYSIYGLGVSSELFFPELTTSKSAKQVRLRFCTFKSPNESVFLPIDGRYFVRPQKDVIYFFWPDGLKACVRQGKEILIHPDRSVKDQALRLEIFGPLFGALLSQRGSLVLHASAVEMKNSGVAFLGESGAGKSTLVAALGRAGYPLVTDNLLAIEPEKNFLIWPGASLIKLKSDSTLILGENFKKLTPIEHGSDKRYLSASTSSKKPLRLKKIYFLTEGKRVEMQTMPKRQALITLIRHSYGAGHLSNNETISSHFEQCAELAKTFSMQKLTRSSKFSSLTELVERVKEDFYR